ncbi:uncharacterized protein PHALS_14312 [Plasmopara halstedii]|uniref:Uncharacterized protein n=1 Tax=Plasmopara halstedii TaxID=4781 RepID=A0A0P1ATM4_PLAHL|nr:uncharacterized protein PHALS_14312 [Plasmopara halstedii]CEG44042.1 hypothetical protein PHALS_14312 [Plasmopara halstedii]|eukprot:XP_024580411.1 hypothetical protein PHALS_14312 [Plasmopara halstedii]
MTLTKWLHLLSSEDHRRTIPPRLEQICTDVAPLKLPRRQLWKQKASPALIILHAGSGT